MTVAVIIALLAAGASVTAKPWVGPGRFCGYATAIDLLPGETIKRRELGIHQATYVWRGAAGIVHVREINAAAPFGSVVRRLGIVNGSQLLVLGGRRKLGRYVLWDGDHLVAYLSGPGLQDDTAALSTAGRVRLVDYEGGAAEGCKYKMLFSWG